MIEPLSTPTLPRGIRARFVDNINGLRMHVLEAGFEEKGRPCLLLLHGFPELAYSWRKVMLPLAAAGYHVVAPDQRGYGRTTGWDDAYDTDLGSFRVLNVVRDALGLVSALGYRSVAGVVGHDFGSPVAAWCALLRPDVFRSVVLMSAPFAGPAVDPVRHGRCAASQRTRSPARPSTTISPRSTPPRKHYHWYYSTRAGQRRHDATARRASTPSCAPTITTRARTGKRNKPHTLASWSASELAKLPTYYVMELDKNMAETVAPHMPSPAEIAACTWLPEPELAVYSAEYARTGFQGGLNWYRTRTVGRYDAELEVFSGRTIDQPSCFISGKSDWGVFQAPGAFERMQNKACTRMLACHLVDGAGHWVQQEQPEAVCRLLLDFLRKAAQA